MSQSGFCRKTGFAGLVTVFCFLFMVSVCHAAIIYVDSGASGGNDGSTWTDAYTDLQTAIDNAASGDEVWVAAGTYTPSSYPNLPSSSDTREVHFSLKNNVAVYGGFAGTETARDQRNPDTNLTELSGDLSGSDGCYHVFYHPDGTNLDSTAILDGFTITSGYADGSDDHAYGGGMFNDSSSPMITNCSFDYNEAGGDGGGIYNNNSSPTVTDCSFYGNYAWYNGGGMNNYNNSSPTVTDCSFDYNEAYDYGGGMENYVDCSPVLTNCTFTDNYAYFGGGLENFVDCSPVLTNCTFNNNWADYGGGLDNYENCASVFINCTFNNNWADYGGGMYNFGSSSVTLTNCTFNSNGAYYHGGGMYNEEYSSPVLTNCTFSSNYAYDYGGGMFNGTYCYPTLTNCILWGNTSDNGNTVYNYEATPTFSHCNIQYSGGSGDDWTTYMGTDGGDNIDTDPLFVRNPGTYDADDMGDLHLTKGSPCIDLGVNSDDIGATDMDGETRINNSTVDMGADEFTDTDGDGMPDYWETLYGVDSPDDDPDTDGLTNLDELSTGTDPTNSDSDGNGTDDDDEDYDEDGLTNSEEIITYGTAPNKKDTDDDGVPDNIEIERASNPSSAASMPAAMIIYVDSDAAGDNNGTTWAHAFTDLQSALSAAVYGDEIWVAEGTYTPSAWPNGGSAVRERHFTLVNGVSIYGGFDGTETSRDQRDIEANETILSGDIGTEGDMSDNCYHVFYHTENTGLDTTAVLNGFTITGGNADGSMPYNQGGGIYNDGVSPTISNCIFSGNNADYYGGGMYNRFSASIVTNCVFKGNAAQYGGGIRNAYSDPALTNCTLSGNSAEYGGGMHNYVSSPALTNCILWGNSAETANEIYNDDATPTFSHCNIRNSGGSGDSRMTLMGTDGGGNIDSNPLFVRNPGTNSTDDMGDLHLTPGSPCVDRGLNSDDIGTTDMDGESRINNSTVDMGADEYTDTDGDGMPDYWETLYGVSLPGDDPDTDGLTNLNEFLSGTDPADSDSDGNGTNDGDEDYDEDGLTNSEEIITYGTAPNKKDTDDDGVPDNIEIERGTDPSSAASMPATAVIYVDSDAAGDNNGTTWPHAFTNLQSALSAAVDGDEIWVAEGTYTPSAWPNGGSADREKHFTLVNGVSIYGGFDGTEASRELRDINENKTTLSGDIGTEGDVSDNCYHVFYHTEDTGLGSTAVLNGFTITGGNADGSEPHNQGGGIYNDMASPTLLNCTFSDNSANGNGGGMYCSLSVPALTDCTFSNNSANTGGGISVASSSFPLTGCTFDNNAANGSGGGMYCSSSSPTLTDCDFSLNSAGHGGAIFGNYSSQALVNCTFSLNSATGSGGAIYYNDDNPTLTNCVFAINSSNYGGAIYNYYSSPVLTNCTYAYNSATNSGRSVYNYGIAYSTWTNCIFWNDPAGTGDEVYNDYSYPSFSYCNILNSGGSGDGWDSDIGTDGGNNIDADPLFVRDPLTNDASDTGDVHLTFGSPCIDQGSTDAADDISTDMDGEARIFNAVADMGADEFVDTDGDHTSDYLDDDDDGDGTADDLDECDLDPNKIEAGACGCGVEDLDLNNNGVYDCLESGGVVDNDDDNTTGDSGSGGGGGGCFITSMTD